MWQAIACSDNKAIMALIKDCDWSAQKANTASNRMRDGRHRQQGTQIMEETCEQWWQKQGNTAQQAHTLLTDLVAVLMDEWPSCNTKNHQSNKQNNELKNPPFSLSEKNNGVFPWSTFSATQSICPWAKLLRWFQPNFAPACLHASSAQPNFALACLHASSTLTMGSLLGASLSGKEMMTLLVWRSPPRQTIASLSNNHLLAGALPSSQATVLLLCRFMTRVVNAAEALTALCFLVQWKAQKQRSSSQAGQRCFTNWEFATRRMQCHLLRMPTLNDNMRMVLLVAC
jgi:hypothetical protein